MNIVLFEAGEVEAGYLPNGDERVAHVRKVLKREVGDVFDAGEIHGRRGKATVLEYGEEVMRLSFELTVEEPGLLPIDLVVGLSRPQTMRKILNEATTLGVRSIRFVMTERGEPSYAESKLWSTGEWRRHVVAGAAQAFTTRLPVVTWGQSLEDGLRAVGRLGDAMERMAAENKEVGMTAALRGLERGENRYLALDNYEAERRLGEVVAGSEAVGLAIGSERGWTGAERELFRKLGWTLVGMGERVLRTETAVVAAVSVARELI